MGKCLYCGNAAGLLRRFHKECLDKRKNGENEIASIVAKAAMQKYDRPQLQSAINDIAASSFIKQVDTISLVVQGWEHAVESALDDSVLSPEEEEHLRSLARAFSLSRDILNKNGAFSRMEKAGLLRRILNGDPFQVNIRGNIPFNFQKSEKLVYIFENTDYYEDKMRITYAGGSEGFSVRIARGLYYRVNGFRGERIQTSETIHADTGMLAVTTKNIYFSGSSKRFRIPYAKIVAFEPYANGIGIQKDAASAKPQMFSTEDGWFAYNLIVNLARM